MAAKEHQGLTITVIVLSILTVIGFGMTFWYYRQLEEMTVKADKATQDASKANQEKGKADTDAAAVRKLIGFGPEEKIDDVLKTYEADLAKLADNFPKVDVPADQRNYRRIDTYLSTELRDAQTKLAEFADREKKLTQDFTTAAVVNEQKVATIEEAKKKLEADYNAEYGKFKTAQAGAIKRAADLETSLAETRKASDEALAKSNKDYEAVTKELNYLTEKNRDLASKIDRGKETQALVDGKITRVNQKSRLVWLNIGRRDGLKPQTSFSVLDADDSNPLKRSKKGRVEVTRIMEDHLSEARILDDDIQNPLMPGDLVFSPVFESGETERFAFIGILDIDGDKRSDRDRLVALVEKNGGHVDAEISESGEKIGQITVQTRYLVMGIRPDDQNVSEEYRKNFGKMLTEAEQLGLRQMSLTEFLDHMGYKSTERVVVLGKGALPSDFKAELPHGVQRTPPQPKERFKPRVPKPADDAE